MGGVVGGVECIGAWSLPGVLGRRGKGSGSGRLSGNGSGSGSWMGGATWRAKSVMGSDVSWRRLISSWSASFNMPRSSHVQPVERSVSARNNPSREELLAKLKVNVFVFMTYAVRRHICSDNMLMSGGIYHFSDRGTRSQTQPEAERLKAQQSQGAGMKVRQSQLLRVVSHILEDITCRCVMCDNGSSQHASVPDFVVLCFIFHFMPCLDTDTLE